MTPFLTAQWRHLLNVTFLVPPEKLQPHVPLGLTLDVQDGKAFASIVAFDFLDTKVRGLRIPFHVNFPEINLRFYVKDGDTRGVVFIKELVPKYCIALVAKRIYNEPYEAARMKSHLSPVENGLTQLSHDFEYKGAAHNIRATFSNNRSIPAENTLFHYFKEHQWGYGVSHSGKTLSYEVQHPVWEIVELVEVQLNLDFAAIYGEKWAFLKDESPYCSCLALGSEIKVFPASTR